MKMTQAEATVIENMVFGLDMAMKPYYDVDAMEVTVDREDDQELHDFVCHALVVRNFLHMWRQFGEVESSPPTTQTD